MMGIFVLTIIGSILVVLGLIFVLFSLGSRWLYGKMIADCTACTVGKLERFIRKKRIKSMGDTRHLISYYPVFTYTVNGQRYECTGGFGTANMETFDVKNKVIFYNPSNPAHSYTDPKAFTIVTTLFFWLGIGLTLVGILLPVLFNV